MRTCRDIVWLLASEEHPSWQSRIEVAMHVRLCWRCRRYQRQLIVLGEALAKGTNAKMLDDEARRALETSVIDGALNP